jgi:hypothetical protein
MLDEPCAVLLFVASISHGLFRRKNVFVYVRGGIENDIHTDISAFMIHFLITHEPEKASKQAKADDTM